MGNTRPNRVAPGDHQPVARLNQPCVSRVAARIGNALPKEHVASPAAGSRASTKPSTGWRCRSTNVSRPTDSPGRLFAVRYCRELWRT